MSSRAQARETTTLRFRLSTWNCFGMGRRAVDAISGVRAPAPERLRHGEVALRCVDPEVLCIQELFSRDAQQFFDDLSRHPRADPAMFSIRDHNRVDFSSVTVRGTGLGIRSRGELVDSKTRHFRARTGWDRLARKGMLHARVALRPELELDLVTVHLQAGEDRAAVLARRTQLAELSEFVARIVSPERTCIVCGDFNIDGLAAARATDEYRRLSATLPGFADLGADDDLPTFDPAPQANALAFLFEPNGYRQRLDYIFLRPPERGRHAVECDSVSLFLHEPLVMPEPGRGGARFASDHYGLLATFEVRDC